MRKNSGWPEPPVKSFIRTWTFHSANGTMTLWFDHSGLRLVRLSRAASIFWDLTAPVGLTR